MNIRNQARYVNLETQNLKLSNSQLGNSVIHIYSIYDEERPLDSWGCVGFDIVSWKQLHLAFSLTSLQATLQNRRQKM